MKNKLLSLILTTATILASYTVGTMQPMQTVNASTPKQISITNAIPICDIAGYFYDKYGYLCFELGDTIRQMDIHIQKSVRNFRILKIQMKTKHIL